MIQRAWIARSLGLVAALAIVVSVRADIVFNNFGPGDAFSASGLLLQGEAVGTIGNVDQAAQFTVGSSDYALTSISLGIGVGGPGVATGPLGILLATDSGGLPGATLRTLPVNVTSTGQQVVTGTDNATFILQANTTYWVIADAQGTLDGGWDYNTTGDTGPTAGRSNNGPWSLHNPGDRFALRVEGRAVPEPASLALLGMAAAGLLATGRRRRAAR